VFHARDRTQVDCGAPRVAPDRLKILRNAFARIVADPEFKAELR
jgi:hypothetical protein